MVTGLVVVGLGDALAQYVSPQYKKLDWKRLGAISLYGFFVCGGIGHVWYKGLDKFLGEGMDVKSALKKTLLDQLIIAPPEILIFLGWSHYSSESTQTLSYVVNDCFLKLLMCEYSIWIPAQFINFFWVPEKHRVLFMCLVSVVWYSLISYTSHNPNYS